MGRGLLGVISTTAMALPIEFSKMKHKKVRDEKIIENIKENGLYHFTSEENSDKIFSSGYIKPSGVYNSHLTRPKTYMFCGLPSIDIFRKNISLEKNPFLNEIYEFNAVYMKPNEECIKKLKVRNLNDDVIVKDGKFYLPENRIDYIDADKKLLQEGAFKSKIVINIDENDNLVLENFDINKHGYKIENDESGKKIIKYKPSEKVVDILKKERERNTKSKEWIKQFDIEKKTVIDKLKEKFTFFKNRNMKRLVEPQTQEDIKNDFKDGFKDSLSQLTNNEVSSYDEFGEGNINCKQINNKNKINDKYI